MADTEFLRALVVVAAMAACAGCGGQNSPIEMSRMPNPSAVTLEHCNRGFHIFPERSTIYVGEKRTLRDKLVTSNPPLCLKYRESAKWSASGGKLKVNYQGWMATFSALPPARTP